MSRADGPPADRNQEATIYIVRHLRSSSSSAQGNLDERATDSLVWELMLQAGPVTSVHLPKDRVSMSHQGFGFCEFHTADDADYACKIMNQIKLFGKPIRVNMASSDRRQLDIGANLFIGGLDWSVDERQLWDAFSHFGTLVQTAQISRDPSTGESKGYGFVNYDSFEASDAAIEAMDGQHLGNKTIVVQYAFKKGGDSGERHGSQAERLLAAQARKNNAIGGSATHQYTAPIVPAPLITYQNGVPTATPLQVPQSNAYASGMIPGAPAPVAGLIGAGSFNPPPPPPGFR